MKNALKFKEKMGSCYTFNAAEQLLVDSLHTSALTHAEMWDGSIKNAGLRRMDRDKLKVNVKEFLEIEQDGYCYYCGFSFKFRNGERGYKGMQRDHIAPKSKYKQFTFESKNLILACSKCNSSDYKGDSQTVNKKGILYSNYTFKIIHPYFDEFSLHLELKEDGQLYLVNNSKKGKATKDMFGLDEGYEIQLRAMSQLYDKYNVSTADELKIAMTVNLNLTTHK